MTNTTKVLALSLAFVGLTSAAGFAQQATIPDFASVDTDLSAGISLAEAQVYWADLTTEQFASLDTDGNGELSADEFATLTAATTPAQ